VQDWGQIQEEIEHRIQRGGRMSEQASHALELRDLRKSFGKTEIIRGANLAVRRASAWPSSAPTARARARCST
jgi:hypothetical protein